MSLSTISYSYLFTALKESLQKLIQIFMSKSQYALCCPGSSTESWTEQNILLFEFLSFIRIFRGWALKLNIAVVLDSDFISKPFFMGFLYQLFHLMFLFPDAFLVELLMFCICLHATLLLRRGGIANYLHIFYKRSNRLLNLKSK